jgi:multisubunit Na+/H+ antiporter MnhB subunit
MKILAKCHEFIAAAHILDRERLISVIEFLHSSDFLHKVVRIVSIIIFIGLHVCLLQQAIIAPVYTSKLTFLYEGEKKFTGEKNVTLVQLRLFFAFLLLFPFLFVLLGVFSCLPSLHDLSVPFQTLNQVSSQLWFC